MRVTEKGVVALEIEWNNKDPFFNRDLDNFQRLHSEGAISVGVIVTRGSSLQENLIQIISACVMRHKVAEFGDLEMHYDWVPTPRQRNNMRDKKGDFGQEWVKQFVKDKFGQSTTHWKKLQDRIKRGVGNPCPLLLVGIPDTVIYQGK